MPGKCFYQKRERSQPSLSREHWQFGQDKDSSFHLTSQRFAHSCDIHTSDIIELFPSPFSKSWLGVAFWTGTFIIFSFLYTFPFYRNPLHNNHQQWVIPNSSWEGRTKRQMWNYCHFMKLLIFKVSIVLFLKRSLLAGAERPCARVGMQKLFCEKLHETKNLKPFHLS